MRKYLVLLIIIVILGLAAYLLFSLRKSGNEASGGSTGTSGLEQLGPATPLAPETIPNGNSITFGTSRGSVITNNFYKIAQGSDGDALVIRRTPQYEIMYDAADSTFGIFITEGPVASSERAAENDLVNILGISKAQVCLLSAVWSVSVAVNENAAGRNYPLSFCSEAGGSVIK